MFVYTEPDGSRMPAYLGGWDRAAYPAAALEASQVIDPPGRVGWAALPAVPLAGGETPCLLRAAWDGLCLHLCVEIPKPAIVGEGPYDGPKPENPPIPADRDCALFALDFTGARTVSDSDGRGILCLTAAGETAWYHHDFIPTLSSIFDPTHPEYPDRLAGTDAWRLPTGGYCLSASFHVEDLSGPVAAEVCACLGDERLYWSHRQPSLYRELDHAHPNAVDWGSISFPAASKTGSPWRIRRTLRYLASPAHQKGVWTERSQRALDEAKAAAESALTQPSADLRAAAQDLEAAVLGLRWADTRFPDPYDLPESTALPDPFRFFGSGRRVASPGDWADRRAELLALAEFYEYGHRPAPPDRLTLRHLAHMEPGEEELVSFGPWQFPYRYTGHADKLEAVMTVGEQSAVLPFTVYLPERGETPAPVVLSFDGDSEAYRKAGFAVVKTDPGTAGDVRTVDYVWGTRRGPFYELFPFHRHGPEALLETGSEMAAAWCLSRVIDGLEQLCSPGGRYDGLLDAGKLAVTGFSIHGKYAFVSALYDERIGVCIPGASGATGLSPWRFVYAGQVHRWTGTPFDCGDPAFGETAAFGTEALGNAVRHNRARGNALFARFLTPGDAYRRLPGAYGYGLRLPFDQSCLAATLAGRALVLVNTPNDYNDGSVSDALTLEVLKPVYRAPGCDPERYLRFNYRLVQSQGDPHGMDDGQTGRSAAFLRHYFLNEPLPAETDVWLGTDPFALPVCGGVSAYDYYWGGFDAITGGGEQGPGWYSTLPKIGGET